MSLEGAYTLIARLGEGGMAEVFKAIKRGPDQFEKPIALKRILPHYADQEGFIKMLSAEARLQAGLDHPNIVQLLDFFKHGDTFMIALEYVPGKNLKKMIFDAQQRNVEIPWEAFVYIVSETLKGLDFAHKRKGPKGPLSIVHRDISPQNILISYEGHVKLSDFGIALANIEREQTQSGILKGKYRYLSPEQLDGKQIDHRSDLFSIGVVLYELLAQKHPFDQGSDFETMKKISAVHYTPLTDLNLDLPPALIEVTQACLQKEYTERPEDAHVLRQRLLEEQDQNWLTNGSGFLKELIEKIYPKPSDRTEPSIENTPVLSMHGTPITGVVHPTESVISVVNEPTERESRKKSWPWILFGMLAIGIVGAVFFTRKNSPQPHPIPNSPKIVVEDKLPKEKPATSPAPSPPNESKTTTSVQVKKAPEEMGVLRIYGPKGAKVFIAGHKIGTLPMKDRKLEAKPYLVSIKPRNLPIRLFRIEVLPGKLEVIRWSQKNK